MQCKPAIAVLALCARRARPRRPRTRQQGQVVQDGIAVKPLEDAASGATSPAPDRPINQQAAQQYVALMSQAQQKGVLVPAQRSAGAAPARHRPAHHPAHGALEPGRAAVEVAGQPAEVGPGERLLHAGRAHRLLHRHHRQAQADRRRNRRRDGPRDRPRAARARARPPEQGHGHRPGHARWAARRCRPGPATTCAAWPTRPASCAC